MKRALSIISLLFLLSISAESQNIHDADFKVEGNDIVITYTLDAIADIDIFCSTDGGKTFGKPLQNISGDVGLNVMPGKKKAVWHVYAEREMLYSNAVTFKIKVREAKVTFNVDGYLIEMLKISGSTFEMGLDADSATNNIDFMPAHEVTLSDFCMAKNEVTVELFKMFIDETGYKTDADRYGGSYLWGRGYWELSKNVNWSCGTDGIPLDETDYNQPVIHVSHNDAQAFCSWLKQKTGENFRLPTEAEWEYVAKNINTYDNDDYPEVTGIIDMPMDVSEWCSDRYSKYLGGSQMNPTGGSDGYLYVFRGCNWFQNDSNCSIYSRYKATANTRRFNLGFRLAL